jgi:hypothetical protein
MSQLYDLVSSGRRLAGASVVGNARSASAADDGARMTAMQKAQNSVRALATIAMVISLVGAAAPAVAMPSRRAVLVVYCHLSGASCSKTFGSGPAHYRRAPSGYDGVHGCRWYGYRSTGLRVYKDYCVPSAATVFAPQDQEAQMPGYRPHELALAGDGSAYVRAVSWSSWTSSSALGRGSYGQDDCSPDCATGRFHYAPTLIVLSQPRMKCGFRVFTHGVFQFPDGPPLEVSEGGAVTWTLDGFPCAD